MSLTVAATILIVAARFFYAAIPRRPASEDWKEANILWKGSSNMLGFIEYAFASVGGVGVLILVWIFVTKKTMEHFFQRDLESYKIRLKAESDEDLERKKKDLQVELETHKNSLKSVSDDRLEEKRKDLQMALESYKNVLKTEGEHRLERFRSELEKVNAEQLEALKSKLQREAQIEAAKYGELQKKVR